MTTPSSTSRNRSRVKTCLVCEAVAASNQIYCSLHKRTVDCIKRQAKTQSQEDQDYYKKAEKNKHSDPQETWKQLVLRVEAECPGLGERLQRGKFDFAEFKRTFICASGVRRRYRARYMTWSAFRLWRKDHEGQSDAESAATWASMLKNADWPRDFCGPGRPSLTKGEKCSRGGGLYY